MGARVGRWATGRGGHCLLGRADDRPANATHRFEARAQVSTTGKLADALRGSAWGGGEPATKGVGPKCRHVIAIRPCPGEGRVLRSWATSTKHCLILTLRTEENVIEGDIEYALGALLLAAPMHPVARLAGDTYKAPKL